MNGVLIIDKPAGWTSHDVVSRVRKLVSERSVGHLGTLDPMATGVLPLVLGKFTRLAQFYLDAEKTYEGCIRFGYSTDTYDAEGEPSSATIAVCFTSDDLNREAAKFEGRIPQIPPPFSAKKVKGVPAYKLAHANRPVELKPVEITVQRLDIQNFDPVSGMANFIVQVSAGTYVRSIAHDLGKALGCGAHLASLRRIRSGDFALDHAVTLDSLADAADKISIQNLMLPLRSLLPQIPTVTANEEQMSRIRHGNSVNLLELSGSSMVKVFDQQGGLVAMASRIAGTLFQPKVVLCEQPEHGGHNINVR